MAQNALRFAHVRMEMPTLGFGAMRVRVAFERHRNGDQASMADAALGDDVIGQISDVVRFTP